MVGMRFHSVFVGLVLSCGCGGPGDLEAYPEGSETLASVDQEVVFDFDERREFAALGATERRWADAVGLFTPDRPTCSATSCDLHVEPFTTVAQAPPEPSGPFCGSFANQYRTTEPAICTAFLVAPNMAMTAAHCVNQVFEQDGKVYCWDYSLAFGFRKEVDDPTNVNAGVRTSVSPDDLYYCEEVVAFGASGVGCEGTACFDDTLEDWALVRLDRNVTGRVPLFVRYTGAVPSDAALSTVGHSSRLPLKLDASTQVIDNTLSKQFSENADSAAGGSGSPLINSATGVVEGIHTLGQPDFEWVSTPVGRCLADNFCSDTTGCPGFNRAQRMPVAAKQIPLHAALVVVTL